MVRVFGARELPCGGCGDCDDCVPVLDGWDLDDRAYALRKEAW